MGDYAIGKISEYYSSEVNLGITFLLSSPRQNETTSLPPIPQFISEKWSDLYLQDSLGPKRTPAT